MQKPGPRPPVGRDRFLRLRLPEHFVVESVTRFGHWIDGNSYLAQDCKRLPDGSYVCAIAPQAVRSACAAWPTCPTASSTSTVAGARFATGLWRCR